MATAYRWNGLAGNGHQGVEAEAAAPKLLRPQLVTRLPRSPRRMASQGRKAALVELYTVKKIDNSRLARRVEPVKLRNLYKTAALGGLIALFFMVYIYQHFHCIDLSFQLEELKARQVQAQSFDSELRLEIATLRDPHRIDVIAQQQLGLKKPLPVQVREYASVDGAEVAAVHYVRPNRAP
jgi:cell division protein FtsL